MFVPPDSSILQRNTELELIFYNLKELKSLTNLCGRALLAVLEPTTSNAVEHNFTIFFPKRVVVVASALAERAARGFSAACVPPGYPSSKLCNVLFARELSGRCAGRGVSAYAVCPGFCLTGLFRSRRLRWWHYALMAPVALLFMRTPEQGAQTILHCALSDEEALESGGVYRDCRRYEPKALAALPPTLPRELWLASERMVAQAHELAL